MNTVLWILQGVLAALYLLVGPVKVIAPANVKKNTAWARRHSDTFLRFIGMMETLGALGLILPMLTGILPWLTPAAAVGLALVQGLAIFTEHIPNKEFKGLPFNLVLLLLAAVVAYGRFTG